MGKGSKGREGEQKDLWNENRTLKKQIKSLQREVNRLRRELGKATHYLEDSDDEKEVEEVKKPKGDQCPKCGSYETSRMPTMIRGKEVVYLLCRAESCGQRTKVQST